MKKISLVACVFIVCIFCGMVAGEELWQEIKGKHFVVFYQSRPDRSMADTVLRRAEEYYDWIGSQIGYRRYTEFWTWDERVKIFLFPDRESFVKSTGQPSWSLGYADRESSLFKSRAIMTFTRENNFIDALLPHEIAHLILFDYIQDGELIPLWFTEGFAQLQEKGKGAEAKSMMRFLAGRGQYIHLDFLMNWDIRQEPDPLKVEIFYAQSLSLVEFLLTKYGRHAFERLVRDMHNGKSFSDALKNSYTNQIASLADLEQQWLQYIRS